MGMTLNTEFKFIGAVGAKWMLDQVEPKCEGDIYTCKDCDEVYVYTSGSWLPLQSSFESDQPATSNSTVGNHIFKLVKCPNCGASLPLIDTDGNGICKCDYCNSNFYVW